MISPRYATHQRLLKAACALVGGPIVEFGAGDYSTPLINELYPGRPKITIESRLEWILRLAHFSLWDHTFVFNPSPFFCVEMAANAGVVFVDCDPAGDRRKIVEWLAKSEAKLVVVHDTEPDGCPAYDWGNCWSLFKYRLHDNSQTPWTSLLSQTIDITNI